MKKIIRNTAIAAALFVATIASTFQANAQDERLSYNKAHHSTIGITVDNATGAAYVIKDKNGNIAVQGKIKNNKTFFISTSRLNKGSYQFVIGSLVLQEFEIL